MRTSLWKFCRSAFLVALFCMTSPVVAQEESKTTSLPDWKATAEMSAQLDPEVEIGAYRIRVPAKYELKTKRDDSGFKLWTWAGARRADRSAGAFAVTLTKIPSTERLETAKFYLNLDMRNVRKARDRLEESKPELGDINGLTFARIKWTGYQKGTKLKMSGFSYVAVDDRSVITLLSQDYKGHEEDLSRAEAAAGTLRKP